MHCLNRVDGAFPFLRSFRQTAKTTDVRPDIRGFDLLHTYFFSRRKHMNQSRQYWSSDWLSIRSLAVPQEPAVGTITSSPGLQSAGVAQLSESAFCRAMMIR